MGWQRGVAEEALELLVVWAETMSLLPLPACLTLLLLLLLVHCVTALAPAPPPPPPQVLLAVDPDLSCTRQAGWGQAPARPPALLALLQEGPVLRQGRVPQGCLMPSQGAVLPHGLLRSW